MGSWHSTRTYLVGFDEQVFGGARLRLKGYSVGPGPSYSEGDGSTFRLGVEKKLHDLAAQSGRGTDELLQDALADISTIWRRRGTCLTAAIK